MTNATLEQLPPEVLHRIFDYCDDQTILLSIRGVCRQLRDVSSTYNRFELKYNLNKNWNYHALFHFLSPTCITSLIIDNTNYQNKSNLIPLSAMNILLTQFTQLRSLEFIDVQDSIIENIVSMISSGSLNALSIYGVKRHTNPQIISVAAKFNLQKFAVSSLKLSEIIVTSWPTNWRLTHLEIDVCHMYQYLSIVEQMPNLRTLVMKDCIVDVDLQMKVNVSSQQLKSLTITNCCAHLHELDLLLSTTPSLTHLELIFNEYVYDRALDGQRLEGILSTKVPLLQGFTLFFAYRYALNSRARLVGVKSLIAPFLTSFWLEEKHWHIACDHAFQTRMIRIYTTPIKRQYKIKSFSQQQREKIIDLFHFDQLEDILQYMPSRERQLYVRMQEKRLDDTSRVFSERRMRLITDSVRCKISSEDYICRLSQISFDASITKEALTTVDLSDSCIDDQSTQDLAAALEHDNTLLSLNLLRNRIGDAGAECLANALKSNTTLNTINLSSNRITDVGAQHLAKCLEHNTSLIILNLDHNIGPSCIAVETVLAMRTETTSTTLNMANACIGDVGVEILAKALRSNTTIITLNLSNNNIGDIGAEHLSSVLKQNTTLKAIDLSENLIEYAGARCLLDCLKYNTTLTALELHHNKSEYGLLAETVIKIRHDKTLTAINLSSNWFNTEDAQIIAVALCGNQILVSLKMSNTQIGCVGVQHLMEVLQRIPTFTKLDVSKSQIGNGGMQVLEHYLRDQMTLTTLNISNNDINDDEIKALAEALRVNKTLTQLDISSNQVTSNGAKYLTDSLKHNSTLTKLNISNNKIGTEGAQYFADVLETTNQLTELNVSNNQIENNGTKRLCNALQHNTSLTLLDLSSNTISLQGTRTLAAILKQNTTLTELHLRNSQVQNKGAEYLADALKSNTTLVTLNLQLNQIDDEGAKHFAGILGDNKVLQSLCLGKKDISIQIWNELKSIDKNNTLS
ncbi:unnamed protein product [Adineta ricciae]|uniref:F-box domain-containing protein n=1 Tax=Adineta ricciae TaxID=249248 RepID=A0A814V5A8_ADIRI|nr:unnamed protein product [Adineta ricciae]